MKYTDILAYLVGFLPVLSFAGGLLLNAFTRGEVSRKYVPFMTTFLIGSTAVCAWILGYKLFFCGESVIHLTLFPWISGNGYEINWSIMIDHLSVSMLFLISTVSFFVHLYSIEYMHEEPGLQRFMINISFFTFAMIMLVTSDNLLQLFFGWEGVGVASYLLIGFFHTKLSANLASIKAFLVNRVADVFMICGIALIFYHFGSINFSDFLNVEKISLLDANLVNLICGVLFVGCMGKSAQIILHVWLPDAMEGPTPVSALIHAATMVTAGVFLLCRCAILYDASPLVRDFILYIGAFTALFAASCAIVQTDIKKIIAYSTCSQLGYMFMACGAQFYTGGMSHLITHGFFKALLFLCAGSVIHGMHHEQNIFNMGGLKSKMPITFFAMMIGTIAICGVPPFAGFYSKDAIIESLGLLNTFSGRFSFYVGNIVAFLTCFYSFRLMYKVFFGAKSESAQHAHESGLKILIPLCILTIFATISGHFLMHIAHFESGSGNFLLNSVQSSMNRRVLEYLSDHAADYTTIILVFFGFILATICYILKPKFPNLCLRHVNFLYQCCMNKWYFDELYGVIFVKPYVKISNYLGNVFDFGMLDRILVDVPAKSAYNISQKTSFMQSGEIHKYAFITFACVIAIILIIM